MRVSGRFTLKIYVIAERKSKRPNVVSAKAASPSAPGSPKPLVGSCWTVGSPAGGPVVPGPCACFVPLGSVVLVTAGEGRFQPRTVTLGMRGDDWVQVTDGVKSGDQVVVGANFLIDSESRLRNISAPKKSPAPHSESVADQEHAKVRK